MQTTADIGLRLKTIRKFKSLSQKQVANALGVSYQQIQKYEQGINRISATTLLDLQNKLDINLLEGYPADHCDLLSTLHREEIELLKNFRKIDNRKLQATLLQLLKTMTTKP